MIFSQELFDNNFIYLKNQTVFVYLINNIIFIEEDTFKCSDYVFSNKFDNFKPILKIDFKVYQKEFNLIKIGTLYKNNKKLGFLYDFKDKIFNIKGKTVEYSDLINYTL